MEELELQTFPGLVEKAAHLRDKVKNLRTETTDFDASLQKLQMLQAKVTGVGDYVANVMSALGCGTERSESVQAALCQKKSR